MRLLVTGGTGFLGRRLVAALGRTAAGTSVHALGRRECDLSESVAVVAALLGRVRPDAVIHLAGSLEPDAALCRRHNVEATRHLLGAVATECPGAMVVIAGSTAVYGRGGSEAEPLDESATCTPKGPYAESKWVCEQLAQEAASRGLRVVVARISNPVGPGMRPDLLAGSVARQVAAIERDEQSPVLDLGDTSTSRDFLHVDDVVSALWTLSQADVSGRVFNVASGAPTVVTKLIDLFLQASTRRDITLEAHPERASRSAIKEQWLSSARLRALGWAPRLSLQAAVEETLSAART